MPSNLLATTSTVITEPTVPPGIAGVNLMSSTCALTTAEDKRSKSPISVLNIGFIFLKCG
jgi:hypothetical protein